MAHDIMPHHGRSSADTPKEPIGGYDGTAEGVDKPSEKAATSAAAAEAAQKATGKTEEKPAEAAAEAPAQSKESSEVVAESEPSKSEPQVLEANDKGELRVHTDAPVSYSKDTPASPPAIALTETSAEDPAQAPTQASTGQSAPESKGTT
jgi:hypothetical protein